MVNDSIRIVEMRPELRAQMFDLLRTCLGERETVRRNEEFWGWKHERSPFGASTVLLGEEAGELVGLRVFLPWCWLAAGKKSYSAVRAVDTVTHPEHQRRGIFSRLTLAGLDLAQRAGRDFVFNTPNGNSMPGYLKMGWKHVDRLPMFLRILRPARFFTLLARGKLLSGQALATGAPGRSAGLHAPDAATMGDFLARGRGIAPLIAADAALRGPGLTTARSTEFLHWRYAEHPYVPYYVETVESDGWLAGALIWRINERNGLREGMVCDLLLAQADRATVRQLLHGVIAKAQCDYLIAHFGADTAHLALLRRSGFWRLPAQGMHFTVRCLSTEVSPDPTRTANWSLCLGDLEIF